MAKYEVVLEIVHTYTLPVDAEDEAEAKDDAKEKAEANYRAGVKPAPSTRIKSCTRKL